MLTRLTTAMILGTTLLLLPACTSESDEPADTPEVTATLPADAGAGVDLPTDMADIPDEVTSHLDDAREAAETALAANIETISLRFKVQGMHCDGCATGLTDVLTKIDGVVECDVSYEKSSAVVKVTDPTVAEEIMAAIEKATYTGELVEG